MSTTAGAADPAVLACATLAELPADAAALLEDAPDLFGSSVWWSVVLSHAVPAGATPVLAVLRAGGRSRGVVPLLRLAQRLQGLTTPYSCLFSPALADADTASLAALACHCRMLPVTRLDCLPAEASWVRALPDAAARAGMRTLAFEHFGNWSEDVAGLDWASYLGRRPGALRETVRRRLRRAEALTNARFTLATRPPDVARAVAAYEHVYARSWKQPEPFPSFHPALIAATAAAGWLRLGVWSIDAVPVAAQIWVVVKGHATVLKLAHDEAFKAQSPGTVLTALMLRHLLEREQVRRIDFGRGDDPYKRGWASERQQRIGMELVDPRRPAGFRALSRHAAGRVARSVRAFLPRGRAPG